MRNPAQVFHKHYDIISHECLGSANPISVGIMPGSMIPLNCEPLTADIHGCLQKMPRMSDGLRLYFHLRSSLSGCFSSLLKFRFDCLWTTLFLVQLCLQVDSGTKIKHIYSARFQLSLLWTFLLFVSCRQVSVSVSQQFSEIKELDSTLLCKCWSL